MPLTQQHTFNYVAVTGNSTKSIQLDVSFLVKRVKINFAYSFVSDLGVCMGVTSNLVYGDTVGVLNKYALTSAAPAIYNSDVLSTDNCFTYIYREPKKISGGYDFTFSLFSNYTATTIASGSVLIHCEFLSE